MRAERGRAWQKKRMPTLKEAIPFSAFTPEASSDSGFKLVWLLTSASRICCIFTVHRLDAAGGAGGGHGHSGVRRAGARPSAGHRPAAGEDRGAAPSAVVVVAPGCDLTL